MTLIWLACVTAAWTPATGPVVGYHTKLGDVAGADVYTNQAAVCLLNKYEEMPFRVQGFDAGGEVGPWSDPLMLARVHDFDADGISGKPDGVVGWPDWSRFIGSFGCSYRASGVAACP